jgi:uncharacterized protein YndB with AHSA1/START domain
MLQDVKLNIFYPHPPERVWKALTDRRALAAWMMENDFEPCLGHKFRFRSEPIPGVEATIHCEVIELDEPNRLIYTWRDSSVSEPSLVVWTLTAVDGGTQLQLRHQEHSYALAASSHSNTRSAQESMEIGMFLLSIGAAASAEHIPSSNLLHQPLNSLQTLTTGLHSPQSFGWDYYLNQQLPSVLMNLT